MSLMKWDDPEPLPPPSLLFISNFLKTFPRLIFFSFSQGVILVKSLMKPNTLDDT